MDEEIKKLIEEYVHQLENQEMVLVSFQKEIKTIISHAEKELHEIQSELDTQLDTEIINEKEYLEKFRVVKNNILNKTKDNLKLLLDQIEKK